MLEWTTTMIGQLLKIPLVPRFYSNHLEPSLQATLSRLADLDLQFDCLARIGVPCEVLERRPKPEAPVAADGPVNAPIDALPVPY